MLDNFSKKWSIAGKSEIIDINKKLGCSIPEGSRLSYSCWFYARKISDGSKNWGRSRF